MYQRTGKIIAFLALAGLMLSAITLPPWLGDCAASYPEPLTSFTVIGFGILMAGSRLPLATLFVCILWAPVHYAVAVEPCAAVQSQGVGGLIYILSYVAVPVVLAISLLLGLLVHFIFPVKDLPKRAAQ